jgi:7-cyano-7-deazaguanine synthase
MARVASATQVARHPMTSTVVLLSGGLDSAVLAYDLACQGHSIHALTFDYGQRHVAEIGAALALGLSLEKQLLSHQIVKLSLPDLFRAGSTMLPPLLQTQAELANLTLEEKSPAHVPGRNMVFLSVAAAVAEAVGSSRVAIASTCEDDRGFPDCRAEFFDSFDSVLMAQGSPVRVYAPYTGLPKLELVRRGEQTGVPFELTISCYDASPESLVHCGRCDACQTRAAAFERAGVEDPTLWSFDA